MPDWVEVALRTLSAVTVLFIITKILGKRQISQLSLFEYITGITLGNLVGYVSLDLDSTWYLGFVALSVWVLISVGAEYFTIKSKKFRNVVDGRATVLVENGTLNAENLRKEKITVDEFLEQLRKKDVYRVADVEFAIMEQSGEINVMLKKEFQPLTADILGYRLTQEREPQTIIIDGHIMPETLQQAGYDEDWVNKELRKLRIPLNRVFIGQVDSKGELTVQTGDKSLPKPAQPQPTAQISELLARFQDELTMRKKLARNDKDQLQYQEALDTLNHAMSSYQSTSKP